MCYKLFVFYLQIMTEFIKENEKSEVTQEMMGDAIDDAMEEDGMYV